MKLSIALLAVLGTTFLVRPAESGSIRGSTSRDASRDLKKKKNKKKHGKESAGKEGADGGGKNEENRVNNGGEGGNSKNQEVNNGGGGGNSKNQANKGGGDGGNKNTGSGGIEKPVISEPTTPEPTTPETFTPETVIPEATTPPETTPSPGAITEEAVVPDNSKLDLITIAAAAGLCGDKPSWIIAANAQGEIENPESSQCEDSSECLSCCCYSLFGVAAGFCMDTAVYENVNPDWCKGVDPPPTDSPTTSPTSSPTVTPTTASPTTASPTTKPTVTANPSANPTPSPVVVCPTSPASTTILNFVGDDMVLETCDIVLQRCQGDCDADVDCAPGLQCFQRDDASPVPGCVGTGIVSMDFCYDPQDAESAAPVAPVTPATSGSTTTTDLIDGILDMLDNADANPTAGPTSSPVSTTTTDLINGILELVDTAETAPAESEDAENDSIKDLINEILELTDTTGMAPAKGEPPNPTPAPTPTTTELTFVGDELDPDRIKLQICQGDCDEDTDCGVGLLCFMRDANEAVPGCVGVGVYGMDYCYRPQDPTADSLINDILGMLENDDTNSAATPTPSPVSTENDLINDILGMVNAP